MRLTSLLACLPLLLAASQAGAAGDAPPIPGPEHRTLEQFGADYTACHEWSDGCAVCLRKLDGTVGCSLAGIACEPRVPVCQHEDEPPPPPGPASR